MKTLILLAALLFSSPQAFAQAPVCMYQDNLSGPATGGEGGGGIYVDVFGANFGSSLSTISITVNGTAVTNKIYLGADKTGDRQQLGFQVASGTTGSGNIVITTPGGSCSNMTFTVRTAAIYFIGSGIDNVTTGTSFSCANLKNGTAGDGLGGMGTPASPWTMTSTPSTQINGGGSNVSPPANARVPLLYYQCINAGDVIVLLNGFNYPYADGGGLFTAWQMDMGFTATSAAPTVLMARPGATATIGDGVHASTGIRDYADVGTVISGLTILGQGNCLSFTEPPTGPFMRTVNNILTAPTGSGSSACLTGGQEAQVNVGTFVLGNYLHNSSCSDAGGVSNKQYHSIYLTGNQVVADYNKIDDCTWNGIQWNYFTDTSLGFGNGEFAYNDITDVNGAGTNIATWDSAQGPLNIFGNIIHHVGLQPASDSDGVHTCLSFPGEATSAVGSGTAQVYNNTFYDCSVYVNSSSSTFAAAIAYGFETAQTPFTVHLTNNIIYQPAYANTSSFNILFGGGSPQAILTGSNNLFFYGGTPSGTTPASSLTSLSLPTNPLFVSATNGPWTNYELQAGSPAIGAGSNALFPTNDFAGVPFTNPPSIGALQYVAAPTFLGVSVSSGVFISPGVSFH